jgi:prepilin-type N-terminal cleavage/methylation domain-containing protein
MKMMVENGNVQAWKPAPRKRRGFTLIEILVVVAIIIILVGAVIAIGANIRTSSMIRATQGELQNLEAAADAYRQMKGGEMPATFTDANYFSTLMSIPSCRAVVTRNNLALFDNTTNPTQLNDSWGNRIRYQPAGANGAAPLKGYFYSCGPNGNPGDTDDIRSVDAAR